ncbi:NADPH-dependent FMN reductase [Actinoplanes awajinensis]|uniref:NADPH-dependent FMN reductase n=1 Tax=Actinoplanes awajinensis subsp. mycoplanecinus TaxID=135947 RepID=A0A101JFH1_9ACTN|nr:NADPH-dependent FMN reductase [Actinoplanes awajinensis]KUL25800.1 NADPH-dependent FMN reductase [Actinoplanes awajinensis subsp. mycoplanecinus]
MSEVLIISGSPSSTSKTEIVGDCVARQLAARVRRVRHLRVRTLPPAAVLTADLADPAIADAMEQVAQADGVVLATPTYKASFSGLLKTFLDLLPQYGLANKVVLPLATGGSAAHVLILDYALRPVVQSMAAHHVVQGAFVLDSHVCSDNGSSFVLPASAFMLADVVEAFRRALPAT